MSTIDQVIARSRQPGAFSERQRFTVARSRAIQKMRKFALADPHFYILELIQGAVANGATYIDVVSQKKFAALSYVGGGFTKNELAQLFDFLFASKTDVSQGALRQMALGVNAMMLMEPEEIIIESGDGTLEGTTRILIRSGDDTVEVGTPEQPLRGTFIRASKLKRSKIAHASNLTPNEVGPPECRAIEDRCLTAPVPILVNDEPIFGYSTVRTPTIYGYNNVLHIDEGDLYGTIGHVNGTANNLHLKLLTYGVWIQTLDIEETPFGNIGGVLCFDRLNKTADHAAIVRDESLQELWARLAPYVHRLTSGNTSALEYDVRTMSGQKLAIPEIRELLQDTTSVLFMSPKDAKKPDRVQRALRIGSLLDAPVLSVPDDQVNSVRYLGGPGTRLIRPRLDNDEDVSFYEQPQLEPPPRPWLIGAMDTQPITMAQAIRGMAQERWGLHALKNQTSQFKQELDTVLRQWTAQLNAPVVEYRNPNTIHALLGINSDEDITRYLVTKDFGTPGTLRARIYTPNQTVTQVDEVLVRIVSAQRLLWAGRIQTTYPGHVLEIELDDVLPRMLLQEALLGEGITLAELLARAIVRHASRDFKRATQRALEGITREDVMPNSSAAHLILSAIAREAILRVRTDAHDKVHLTPSLLTTYPIDLFDLPILETIHGEPRTMAQLIESMEQSNGLLYGVIPEVAPSSKGLDTTSVLAMTTQVERLLMSFFGPSTYVRLDSRDVLATYEEPTCLVRDLAMGMKTYPNFDVLIEFASPQKWTPEQVDTIERSLLFQLLNLSYGSSNVEPSLENRRQALRHLQWFLLRRPSHATLHGLEDLPLFVDSAGRACTYAQILKTSQTHGALLMSDGRGMDVISVGGLEESATHAQGPTIDGLAMDPFIFHALQKRFHVRGAFDFDLTQAEAKSAEHTPDVPFLLSQEINDELFEGTLGIPLAILEDHSIAILDPDGPLIHPTRSIAFTYGVVGRLRRKDTNLTDAQLQPHAAKLISDTIDALPSYAYDSPQWRAAVHVILRHAGLGLSFILDPDHRIRPSLIQPLIQRILELPLFDTTSNFPASAMHLIQEFCLRVDPDSNTPFRDFSAPLSENLHPLLSAWLDKHLHPRNITRLTAHTQEELPAPSFQQDPTQPDLGRNILHWINTLRPDSMRLHLVRGVDPNNQALMASLDTQWSENNPDEHPFSFVIEREKHVLFFNTKHPLIASATQSFHHDPEALAWILLASYALINEMLTPVTNNHELAFQLSVFEALESGALMAV